MKRAPALRGLSNEHHRALVFARRARRAGSEGQPSVAEVWCEAERLFEDELERHFDDEEIHIGRPLEARYGPHPLVQQLYDEHRVLRSFFEPGAGRSREDLHRFAERLIAHVRFEERELFEAAQRLLDSGDLAGLERAHR